MNVVVVEGVVARAPQARVSATGGRSIAFEVTSRRAGEQADAVPVVWIDPPARSTVVQEGASVVVLGRVRRRWFRAGGGTQSRTEVLADDVVARRAPKRRQAIVDRAVGMLDAGPSNVRPGR